ncbi:MAG: extracellular solute-binding protein [Thermoflexales bacterium]|nr:extracellular solute-binding protein [Thermoflexales bacterium]
MKTRLMLVSMLVVLGILLAACGGAATPAATQAPAAKPTDKPAEPAAKPTDVPAAPPAAAGPKGEVTLWHAYGTGSAEEAALTQALDAMKKDMPDVKVNVLQIPFDQVFNKWETEVAAGGGPEMFTVPNDNTGNQARGGLIAPLDDLLKGKTDAFPPASFEGAVVDGKVYGVPGIIKAVALYYNKSTVPTPPATTADLLKLVKDGKKIEINQNAYHNFGFWGAFGGKLMDADGVCTADKGGFADALQFLADLKAAGGEFQTDGGKADTLFRQGQADMIINGPWTLGDYKKDLGDKLGVAPMPAGPAGPATPLAGVDYWHVNPNASAEQQQLAVEVALYLFGPKGAQIYADVAGSPMVAKGVNAKDPLVKAFADAAAAGFPRPQSKEFGNYWGPFGDAVTKVLEGKLTPAEAVTEACGAMNKANGKEAGAAPAEKLTGEITLWHAYGTGSAEEKALTTVLESMAKDQPDLKVNVLQIPFDQVFNKWETEVAAGGGPDMFTVPNDNTGNQARGELIAPLDELLAGKTDAFPLSSFDGAKVDGKIYGVPGIAKAVALYYNKSTVPTPPATLDELLTMVKDGKKIEINQNAYHNFGFWGAFGGKLMDDSGKCVADQGGFADALQFLSDLKAAGAEFQTDGGKADTLFRQGQADMIINGPWTLGDYKKDLGDKLGVAPIPAGPAGPATPLAGVDYWHINPNATPEQQKLAVGAALYIFGPKGAQIYADVSGSPMVAKGVTAADPLVKAFADAAAAGFARPQSAEFGNYWGPFGDAVTKVMEGKLKPAEAVTEACAAMNKANGK